MIRVAESRDVDAIVAVVAAAYRGTGDAAGWTSEGELLGGQRADADMVRQVVADSSSLVLVDVMDDAVRGCIQLEPLGDDAARFGLFAVDPAIQSGGVGGRLLTAVETVAGDDWGRAWMQLEVLRQRSELIAWYRRRGYRPTGETMPFPYSDERFGLPRRDDLEFVVLRRPL